MKNTKNWFKRSLAMLLVVVALVGLVPANAIAAGADNSCIPGDVNSDGKVNAIYLKIGGALRTQCPLVSHGGK